MGFFQTPPRRMALTLRALGWLLRYPDDTLRQALPEVAQALVAEGALGGARLGELQGLIERLLRLPALQAEAEYVEIFDRGRRTSLHLFEHVHGDSRDRGPAMIDLVRTYESAGLFFGAGELPDHLGVAIEYASTQPAAAAREFLAEFGHILRAIFSALRERQSPYACVLGALLELAGERAEAVALPPEPGLDESWAEPEAFGGCSTAGQSRSGALQPIHIHRPPAAAHSARRAA
jgi:nitrate reductase molybdenum cofactor assembly chaperone NarJ/NarW